MSSTKWKPRLHACKINLMKMELSTYSCKTNSRQDSVTWDDSLSRELMLYMKLPPSDTKYFSYSKATRYSKVRIKNFKAWFHSRRLSLRSWKRRGKNFWISIRSTKSLSSEKHRSKIKSHSLKKSRVSISWRQIAQPSSKKSTMRLKTVQTSKATSITLNEVESHQQVLSIWKALALCETPQCTRTSKSKSFSNRLTRIVCLSSCRRSWLKWSPSIWPR